MSLRVSGGLRRDRWYDWLVDAGPWVIAGLLLGLGVHIVSVLALPRLAPDDARARLAAITEANSMAVLDPANGAPLPLSDPAFETAICRFDLRAGVLRVRAPVTAHYTAVSFYTITGLAFTAINDRAATRRVLELHVMTAAQRRDVPENDDETRADALLIVSPSMEGFVVIRALAVQPGLAAMVRDQLVQQANCGIVPIDQVRPG
ncbi:MAG: DUF1254 domain-containing protein [Alphaproteobacteria bacterium]